VPQTLNTHLRGIQNFPLKALFASPLKNLFPIENEAVLFFTEKKLLICLIKENIPL